MYFLYKICKLNMNFEMKYLFDFWNRIFVREKFNDLASSRL